MMRTLQSSWLKCTPLERFLIKGGALWVIWKLIHKLFNFLDVFNSCADFLSATFLILAKFLLLLLGFHPLVDFGRHCLAILPADGVVVLSGCLGIQNLVYFTLFLVAYPGNTKSKYYYIPIGLFILLFNNIFRIAFLAWLLYSYPSLFETFHQSLYQDFTYLLIFFLWYLWIKKYSKISTL
ncbi:MAG: hypothetical protein Q8862_05045 [Bacteroidota bacterium]|nr:hypothetical protein [Bacteroidota bacterium]MDP4205220.1 hypothetical protein [Bacteroidota bacterium]